MYYFITGSKDATIYLQQPDQNAGLDEILEVSKVYYGGNLKDVSRALLKFDITSISQSISSGDVEATDVRLLLRECETEEVPLEFTLYAYPITGSWEMGIGTRFDEITTAGVTWNYREGDLNVRWLPSGTYSGSVTGSTDGLGGVYYTDVSGSQSYTYKTKDVNMDVKSVVNEWLSGSKENNGFIIKYPSSFEDDTNDYGILKFFGMETNTIHQPKLRFGWDDSSFTTGSLSELTAKQIKVTLTDFKEEYRVNTEPKINVFGRELYPQKSFSSTFEYKVVKYLPSTSYYQIRDYHTNDIIVPFSEYTKISCDSNGNYFNLNLNNWETNRTYKVEIKIVRNNVEEYFDLDYTFKVIE